MKGQCYNPHCGDEVAYPQDMNPPLCVSCQWARRLGLLSGTGLMFVGYALYSALRWLQWWYAR